MRLRNFIFSAGIFITLNAGAQPFIDLVSASYQYAYPSHLFNNDEDVIVNSFRVSASLPFKFQEDILLFNPTFERHMQEYDWHVFDPDLVSISIPIAYQRQLKDKNWRITAMFIPRLNSINENILDESKFQPGGAVTVSYRKNDKLKYKLGLYYNAEFFGPYFLPLIGLEYKISDRLQFYCLLPNRANLEYRFSNSFFGGMDFRGITSSYRLAGDGYFLRMDEGQLKLYLDFYIGDESVLFVHAGHSVLRHYRTWKQISTENPDYSELHVNDAWVFQVGYSYRIRFDKK